MKALGKLFALLIAVTGVSAHAVTGNEHGNGGDICEDRFQIIRDDIDSWILKGGSAGLQLPTDVTLDRYNQGMRQQISQAKISCTDQQILIGNAEKTCKNSTDTQGASFILCNTNRFMSTSDSDQYVLVHHEYAGLAGFEVNNGEISRYSISNQITGYLQEEVIKKLVVKPAPPEIPDPFDPNSCPGRHITANDLKALIPLPDSTSVSLGKFKITVRKRSCYGPSSCTDWSLLRDPFYYPSSVLHDDVNDFGSVNAVFGSNTPFVALKSEPLLVMPGSALSESWEASSAIDGNYNLETYRIGQPAEDGRIIQSLQIYPFGQDNTGLVVEKLSGWMTESCLRQTTSFSVKAKDGRGNDVTVDVEAVLLSTFDK